MSLGGILGGIVGGVLGFFIGGPTGALYGASIGFSLGMMIDPMTPDMPTPGTPLPMGADVMINTVGDPLPDLTGTAKITGHLLFYGKERTVAIEQEQEGGKGGGSPDPAITGYEYYMSWGVGIVTGPIDTLYAIYKGDDLIWEGELNIPDSGGQETIILTGHGPPVTEEERSILDPPVEESTEAPSMGSATFYFGSNDQIANTNVGEIIGDDTLNSPYRNFCWCFFDDCYLGTFNRCPTMKFVLRKAPDIAFSESNEIQTYDYNPIHTVWYALHDLSGLPETWLHTEDFAAAAATLASETRGISCFFDKQQSTLDYLQAINNHIDGIIRYGSDGKFHPKLIRDDYTVGGLPLIDENVMLDDPTFSRKAWGDTVNEMKVQYTEIVRDEEELDSQYAITGAFFENSNDFFALTFNKDGITWAKQFYLSPERYGYCYSITQTVDNNLILAGEITKDYVNKHSIIKVSKDDGTVIWSTVMDDNGWDEHIYSIIETSDNGLVYTGNACRASGYDICIVKLTSTGSISWAKTIISTGYSEVSHKIIETSDGGLVISGYNRAYAENNYADACIIKLTSTGGITWAKRYNKTGTNDTEVFTDVQETSDNGFICIGYIYEYGVGFTDIIITKITSIGDISWSKRIETANLFGDRDGNKIIEVSDGYILIGYHPSHVALTKLSLTGIWQWSKKVANEDPNNTLYGDVGGLISTDTGILFAGVVNNDATSNYDISVGHVNMSGEITDCSYITDITISTISGDITANNLSISTTDLSISAEVHTLNEVNTNLTLNTYCESDEFFLSQISGDGDFEPYTIIELDGN